MSRLHRMVIMAPNTLYTNGSSPEPFSEDPRVLNIRYLYVIIIDTTLGYRSRNFVTQTPIIVSAAGLEPGNLRLQDHSSNHYTNSLSKHWALTQCLDSTVWWTWLLTHYLIMVRTLGSSLRIHDMLSISCNYMWTVKTHRFRHRSRYWTYYNPDSPL